ncbi:MAG: hypothetical protein ABQ298_03620 [Puniceicoccaceae bacterium]
MSKRDIPKLIALVLALILFVLALLLSGGCVTVERPETGAPELPPTFQAAHGVQSIGRVELAGWMRGIVRGSDVTLVDDRYILPSRQWVVDFNRYVWGARARLEARGRLTYRKDVQDCDDYASLYVAASRLSHAGADARPIIGKVNRRMPDGTYHQQNFYLTEAGGYLYEPQTGQEWFVGTLEDLRAGKVQLEDLQIYHLILD